MNKLMLNNEWGKMFAGLPDEEAGQLIKAVFSCHAGEPVELENPVLLAVFRMIEEVIIKNREAYEKTCERNAENGRNGGRPKNPEKPKETQSVSEEPTRFSENPKKANRIEKNRKEKNKDNKKDILSGKPDSIPLMVAAGQIIDHLNKKAGTSYKVSSRSTVEMIKARLDEKWTVEDFFRAIDNMTEAWKGDPKMENYLRPATLFQRSKFESYVNWKPRSRTRFSNFPARDDQEHKDLVAKVIAMQGG